MRVQSYEVWGKRLGFLKLDAKVTNSDDSAASLPGSLFLRGPSVAMLVMLVPSDDEGGGEQGSGTVATRKERGEDERYVVLTVQPRIPAGSLAFVELPAGMVEEGDGDGEGGRFVGTAAREIQEELGMTILASELTCLTDLAINDNETAAGAGQEEEGLPRTMYPSAGGCDEYIKIYAHERRMPRAEIRELAGRLTGLRDEGERITLRIVPMRDLWREGARDAKCLSALALWEGLRREGKV